MTFGNPDFVAYATAFGLEGSRVESADGLAPALKAAFARGGVQLVVVPVDYTENSRVLLEELRDHAAKSGGQP
jgi:acetolactate synthase-1/2/3 large subunit